MQIGVFVTSAIEFACGGPSVRIIEYYLKNAIENCEFIKFLQILIDHLGLKKIVQK